MINIGAQVNHKLFGLGEVTDTTATRVTVTFSSGDRVFPYPDAFKQHLKVMGTDTESIVADALAESQRQHEQEKDEQQRRLAKRKERLYIKKEEFDQRNIAFKCNYCDGDHSPMRVGYNGVCSDDMIAYNIDTEHKVWCSSPECACLSYLRGDMSRCELDKHFTYRGSVCYESQLLSEWKTYAGRVQKGQNKGKPMSLRQVQPKSLAVLTTRMPKQKETERFIFGVFLVEDAYEGDDRDEGYVSADTEYRLELKPHEASQLLYWTFHANSNQSSQARWSSGLHRYFDDIVGAQILQAIVALKEPGTAGHTKASEFLAHFCKTKGLNPYAIPAPNGALMHK